MDIGLEIPVFGPSAARTAVEQGASRIELNAAGSYAAGGLTPTLDDLRDLECLAGLNVPVRIMIRPRGPELSGSDFVYSDAEFEIMEKDILAFKASGMLKEDRVDGFVFGILGEVPRPQQPDINQQPGSEAGTPLPRPRCWADVERCARLVQASRPFKAVFHRAFDEIVSCEGNQACAVDQPSWETGLQELAACGFDAILTSGGLGRAIDNVDMLKKITEKAENLGIEIIVGGGLRKHNVGELIQGLGLAEKDYHAHVHSACLSSSPTEEIEPGEVQGILAHLRV